MFGVPMSIQHRHKKSVSIEELQIWHLFFCFFSSTANCNKCTKTLGKSVLYHHKSTDRPHMGITLIFLFHTIINPLSIMLYFLVVQVSIFTLLLLLSLSLLSSKSWKTPKFWVY